MAYRSCSGIDSSSRAEGAERETMPTPSLAVLPELALFVAVPSSASFPSECSSDPDPPFSPCGGIGEEEEAA